MGSRYLRRLGTMGKQGSQYAELYGDMSMPDQTLACVRECSNAIDLVDINRRFRWASLRIFSEVKIELSGRYLSRTIFAVGDSHGAYNGCLGPPPEPLTRRGKKPKQFRTEAASELYVAGTRVDRNDLASFLRTVCGDTSCILVLCNETASVAQEIRLAAKEAEEISLATAVSEWPHLITGDRRQIVIQAGDE